MFTFNVFKYNLILHALSSIIINKIRKILEHKIKSKSKITNALFSKKYV